jgi:predicted metal-dependent phosphoesterase TrpH
MKAKEAQMQGLSITDHDTISAYTPELFEKAKELGIQLLTGAELSSEFQGATVHILAYGFDLHSKVLQNFLQLIITRRTERNLAILKKLALHKMPITEEELVDFARSVIKHKTIGRPHIAALMVRKGYVISERDAFERYLKEGSLCYAAGFKVTPQDTINAIHQARGKAVLAHPHFYPKGRFLKELLTHPFDGIECYYGNLSKEVELPWIKIAQERGLLITGGSDYHGDLKPHIALGCSWTNETTFNALFTFSPQRHGEK